MIAGNGPSPALVVSLVQALPDTSLTHALMLGGREHYGWGHDRHLLAAQADGIQTNTIASGSWKKGKEPKFTPWPRPGMDAQGKPKPEKKKKKSGDSLANLFSAFKMPDNNPFG